MDPKLQHPAEEDQPAVSTGIADSPQETGEARTQGHEPRGFDWLLVGPQGLRVAWSILLFYLMYRLFRLILGTIFYSAGLIGDTSDNSASAVIVSELILLTSMLCAALVMAYVEGRRISSYNLAGPRRMWRFLAGIAAGFGGAFITRRSFAWGGWLGSGPVALTSLQTLRFGALWFVAFSSWARSRRASSAAMCFSRSRAASASGGRSLLRL